MMIFVSWMDAKTGTFRKATMGCTAAIIRQMAPKQLVNSKNYATKVATIYSFPVLPSGGWTITGNLSSISKAITEKLRARRTLARYLPCVNHQPLRKENA